MTRKSEKQGKTKTQSQKFLDIAQKIEANESEEAFERQLRKLAKAKPKKEKPAD